MKELILDVSKSRRSRKYRSRGFSLVEIMVAVLVVSIGLLGMAALMATSLRNAQSANQRTQATNLAYEIIDGIRSNLPNAMRYNSGYSNPAVACAAATKPALTYPATTQLHQLELARWASDVCYALPNGQGQIIVTRTPAGVSLSGETFSTYQLTVNVCWVDDRQSAVASDCNNATAGADTVITVVSSL